MIHDRSLLVILTILLMFGMCSCTNSPQTKKVGVSLWIENDDFDQNFQGFVDGLKLGGYKDKQNLELIVGNPNGNINEHNQIIENFKAKKVDLIFTRGTSASLASKEVTSATPLIFSIVTFPESAGIIESINKGSNKIAGTSNRVAIDFQYKIFSSLVPELNSIAFIRSQEGQPNSKIQLDEFRKYLEKKGIQVKDYAGNNLDEVIKELKTNHRDYDAIYGACDAIVQAGGEEQLAELAKKYNKPSFACNKSAVTHGFMAALVADYYEIGKEAGIKAAQLLDNPQVKVFSSDIASPILHINTEVISKLGLSVPESLQRQTNINYYPNK